MKDFIELANRAAPEIRRISDFIYEHPETAYQEFQAAGKIASFMECNGFDTEKKAAGLDTAVKAMWKNHPGPDTPTVCVIGEYDALKGLGHGCGHNLIAAASLIAARTAADYAKRYDIPLSLCFMGTPAEEGGNGKVRMIEAGAFKGIAMAVMSHPSEFTETDTGGLGVARAVIVFRGRASHAGASPEKGINALDAMVSFYSDMMLWRNQIGPMERVHGIIARGGDVPNIVPERTEAFFYVRAPDRVGVRRLKKQLEDSVAKGAASVHCGYEVNWIGETDALKVNEPLNQLYYDCWKELGRDIRFNHGLTRCGSSDIGNVSQIMPSAHFRFSITGETPGCPGHSEIFRETAGKDTAFENAVKTGAVMAKIMIEYSVNPEFRKKVNADFQSHQQV